MCAAVIALTGRRIDAVGMIPPRFPLECVTVVRRRIAYAFVQERGSALVCSAACGACLIALDEAERLGLRRRIVLPFLPERFRETSVVDRPGNWGPCFDHHVATASATGDLLILDNSHGDEKAYTDSMEMIVREAQALALSGTPPLRQIALIVWEGVARSAMDATASFCASAINAGFEKKSVSTIC